MKNLNLVLLMLLLTGCNYVNGVAPPPFYMCEENQSLLICEDEELLECQGFLLEDRGIIIIEEIDL